MAKLIFNTELARERLAALVTYAAKHDKPQALTNLIDRLVYLRKYGPASARPGTRDEMECEFRPDRSLEPQGIGLTMRQQGELVWYGGLFIHADGDVTVNT